MPSSQAYNSTDNTHGKQPFSYDLFRPVSSVLDNKETLLQFSSSVAGSKEAKSAFVKVAHRHRNLTLANWLDESDKFEDVTVNKTVRRLRFCSSVSTIKETPQNLELVQSSKSCKSSHCTICLRQRSAKISKRIIAALTDEKNKELFKNKHFYFLTLTVKHDEETRNGIYLKQFKGYTQKLYRSKIWKNYFPKGSGWITAYEVTLSENGGYHIHAHILICSPKIRIKANLLQAELSLKWQKITTDSYMIRFDLLNLKSQLMSNIDESKIKDAKALQQLRDQQAEAQKEVYSAVQELIKYGTKAGSFKNWDKGKSNLYADWIVQTKGANFINCSGIFRGLQLTGLKSQYDEKKERLGFDEGKYFIGKTSQLKFNRSTKITHPDHRKKALEKVRIIQGEGYLDITPIIEEMDEYGIIGLTEHEIKEHLNGWVNHAKKQVENQPLEIEPLPELEPYQEPQLFEPDIHQMPKLTESQLKNW